MSSDVVVNIMTSEVRDEYGVDNLWIYRWEFDKETAQDHYNQESLLIEGPETFGTEEFDYDENDFDVEKALREYSELKSGIEISEDDDKLFQDIIEKKGIKD